MSEVLRFHLRQRRMAALLLALGMSGYIVFAMTLARSLHVPIERMAKQFPEAFLKLVGANVPGGYVMAETYNVILPLALVIYAVIIGASAVAGEERDGTMRLLISHPVTRLRVVTAQIAAVMISLLGTIILFVLLASLTTTVIDIGVTTHGVVAQSVHLFMLAACFGMIAAGVGAATGRPEIAAGTAGGIVAVSYLAFAVLPISGHDSWVRLSPWHYYASSNPLANGIDVAHLVVLAVIACVAGVAGVWIFIRRDLKG